MTFITTPVFLLHGIGAHTITLLPLELYLNCIGYKNTHRLWYPVDTMEFEETMDYVDKEMEKLADKNKEILLIGQSIGGVVSNNLHKKGWKVKQAIYIGSPLHGANFLNQLEDILPKNIVELLTKKPYDYLKAKEHEEPPPHPYKTISMGWAYSNFDGCVYQNETMLEEEHHIHLPWADHRTVFANPRLWIQVGNLLP